MRNPTRRGHLPSDETIKDTSRVCKVILKSNQEQWNLNKRERRFHNQRGKPPSTGVAMCQVILILDSPCYADITNTSLLDKIKIQNLDAYSGDIDLAKNI